MPSLASIESSALVLSFLYDISCPIFIFEAIEFSRRFISFSTCAKERKSFSTIKVLDKSIYEKISIEKREPEDLPTTDRVKVGELRKNEDVHLR